MKARSPKMARVSGMSRLRPPPGKRENIPCVDRVREFMSELQAKVNLHTAVTDEVRFGSGSCTAQDRHADCAGGRTSCRFQQL
jgi:hypothetical protein